MKKTLFALVGAAVGIAGLAILDAAHARGDVVAMKEAATPGTIIVHTDERFLYVVQPGDWGRVRRVVKYVRQ